MLPAMGRTTITLDPDMAATPRRLASERGATHTETVNAVIRAGLATYRPGQDGPYREQAVSLMVRTGIALTHAHCLAGEFEDPAIVRKLELNG